MSEVSATSSQVDFFDGPPCTQEDLITPLQNIRSLDVQKVFSLPDGETAEIYEVTADSGKQGRVLRHRHTNPSGERIDIYYALLGERPDMELRVMEDDLTVENRLADNGEYQTIAGNRIMQSAIVANEGKIGLLTSKHFLSKALHKAIRATA